MKVGDYVQRTVGQGDRLGKPLEAPSKAGQITALRTFFKDCQEWEWLPRRFDPLRALAIPRSITALLGPDPRVIADEIWAKLLWAGLNLEVAEMAVSIPLTDDERTAVADGQDALNRLLERLADAPTPAGPTPRELSLPPGAVPLPFLETGARAQDSTRRPCCPPKPLG
ncbi:hypothetical protein [Streptomyces sp. NPDC051286]|uniref:hypothetical protein n=1 Tax=Streptomyces sp. NPDC051286 TaxID=3365647 RepID=UPI0037BE17C9